MFACVQCVIASTSRSLRSGDEPGLRTFSARRVPSGLAIR